jgi:hypothetical protein
MAMNALKQIIDDGGRDDREIAKFEPLIVNVGGHPVSVRAFTLDNYLVWLQRMGTMLMAFPNLLATLEWPETVKGIERVRQAWMRIMSQRKMYDHLLAMFRATVLREPGNEWWRFRYGFFRKRITVQELMDLFFYIYLFNHEAVKKNAIFLLKRLGFVRNKATFLSGSAENLAGMHGAQVKPRYPISPFSPAGQPNSTTSSPQLKVVQTTQTKNGGS